VLPSSVRLLPLLEALQQQPLLQQQPASTLLQVCQLLLSEGSALQTWPRKEQRSAFKFMTRAVQQLQPQALLQLLQKLTEQQHLAQLPADDTPDLLQAPAQLYSTVLTQLQHYASAVYEQQDAHGLAHFTGLGPQLLQLAQQACMATGALRLVALDDGHVLDGDYVFTTWPERSKVSQRASQSEQGAKVAARSWLMSRHAAFMKELRGWQAAGTPAVAGEVHRAAATGQLLQVTGVLKHLLDAPPQQQQQQQQLDPGQVATLLELLVFTRPLLPGSLADAQAEAEAVAVAQDVTSAATGLYTAGHVWSAAPKVFARWLVTPQQQQQQQQQQQRRAKPIQQLGTAGAMKAIWAVGDLGAPAIPLVFALCELDLAATSSTNSSSSSGGGSTHLHRWSLLDLLELCNVTQVSRPLPMPIQEMVADAAAPRTLELAKQIAAGTTKQNSGQFHAACELAFNYAMQELYSAKLTDALQELITAAAAACSRDRKSGAVNAHALTRLLFAMASFEHPCSDGALAAIVQLVPDCLKILSRRLLDSEGAKVALGRLLWSLAVLDIREPVVWRAVRPCIQLLGGEVSAAAARGTQSGDDEGEGEAVEDEGEAAAATATAAAAAAAAASSKKAKRRLNLQVCVVGCSCRSSVHVWF
jgi:hypothetical protein